MPNYDAIVEMCIQESLKDWLRNNGVEYVLNEDHSLMPPYAFLDSTDQKHNLIDLKVFNCANKPNFDIADFRMYEREVREKPWLLDMDYLIFGRIQKAIVPLHATPTHLRLFFSRGSNVWGFFSSKLFLHSFVFLVFIHYLCTRQS